MSINLTWDGNDNRVIRWDIRGNWTTDEFVQSLKQNIELIDQQSKDVFIILNFDRPVKLIQPLITDIWHSQPSQAKVAGILVSMKVNMAACLFLNQRVKLSQNWPCYFVSSLETAYAIVADKLAGERTKYAARNFATYRPQHISRVAIFRELIQAFRANK